MVIWSLSNELGRVWHYLVVHLEVPKQTTELCHRKQSLGLNLNLDLPDTKQEALEVLWSFVLMSYWLWTKRECVACLRITSHSTVFPSHPVLHQMMIVSKPVKPYSVCSSSSSGWASEWVIGMAASPFIQALLLADRFYLKKPHSWFCFLVRNIIFAWMVTVPIAAGLSALMMVILKAVAL